MMKLLGIETSCDETAAAIVEDGDKILSNIVSSQIDIHREFGGVVPEVAARSHVETINSIIDKSLLEAKVDWNEIDGIAVTYGPGLPGALMVGALAAKTLAWIHNLPLYPINHVEAHTYANFLIEPQPQFPILSLTVSGGNSLIILYRNHFDYEKLGETRDDAVGECFDKVAKILGLTYPGGPSIAKAAMNGDPKAYTFPDAKLDNPYEFSFSGLKTSVLRHVQKLVGVSHETPSSELADLLTTQRISDIAASFQFTVAETMVKKVIKAYKQYQPKSVVIAGGVAANLELRRILSERLPIDIAYAPQNLCTDNAAMIAALGYQYAINGRVTETRTLETNPSLTM